MRFFTGLGGERAALSNVVESHNPQLDARHDGRTTMQTADTLIRDAYIVTVDPERRVFTNGYIAFLDGKILSLGPMSECAFEAKEVISGTDRLVMPGMANTHNHLNQVCFRGYNDDRWPVTDIPAAVRALLRQLYVIVDRLDEERSYALTRLHTLEMIKAGYTATHDEHFTNAVKSSVDGSWAALRDSGMRGFLARCIVNSDMVPQAGREDLEEGLLEVERLNNRFASDRVEVAASFLNFQFVAEPEDMRRIRRGAERIGVRFDIDMTDNSAGANLMKRGFEGGQVEYYRSYDLLNEPIYAGKAVNVRPHEYSILAEHDCRVAMVPMLRLFDCVGLPVHHLLKEGLLPGIGTDAPLVSDCQSPFEVMRQIILTQNLAVHQERRAGTPPPGDGLWATSETVIEMATLGGARTLFMDQVSGSLEPGKAADCVVVELNQASMQPDFDRRRTIGSLVWAGESRLVDTVFVAGQKLLEGGRSKLWNEEEVILEAQRVLRDIQSETELETLLPGRVAGRSSRGWTYF